MSTMPMERFVQSMELSAKNLHETIARWTSLDDDLRENFRDSLEWLIENAPERLAAARGDLCERLRLAYATILGRQRDLVEIVGVHFPNSSPTWKVYSSKPSRAVEADDYSLPACA